MTIMNRIHIENNRDMHLLTQFDKKCFVYRFVGKVSKYISLKYAYHGGIENVARSIVFSFRAHEFVYLWTICGFSWNGTNVSH
jgi:hypothetical protein